MGGEERDFLAHVDHSHRVEDGKDQEQDQGDRQEDDDQRGGGLEVFSL